MNPSLTYIQTNSENPIAREYAKVLEQNSGRKFRITFTKADNTQRTMTFIPHHDWCHLNHRRLTSKGTKMALAKAEHDQLNVVEIIDPNKPILAKGNTQPRSVNLGTITEFKII